MNAIQPQFDIIEAARSAGTAVSFVVINFGKLWPACFKEDIQPTVLPAIERLGRWLMVDAGRLRQGEETFENMPPPEQFSWASLSLLIGLDTDPKNSLVKAVSCNRLLIAAFLFLTGFTTALNTRQARDLMHELMSLNGTLNDYPITGELVHQFADGLNGCRDYMVEPSAHTVYTEVQKAVQSVINTSPLQPNDLYKVGTLKKSQDLYMK
jgi:hypothetical protein